MRRVPDQMWGLRRGDQSSEYDDLLDVQKADAEAHDRYKSVADHSSGPTPKSNHRASVVAKKGAPTTYRDVAVVGLFTFFGGPVGLAVGVAGMRARKGFSSAGEEVLVFWTDHDLPFEAQLQ